MKVCSKYVVLWMVFKNGKWPECYAGLWIWWQFLQKLLLIKPGFSQKAFLLMNFRVLQWNRDWTEILWHLPMCKRANVVSEKSFYELPSPRVCFGDWDAGGCVYFQWPQECLAPCSSLAPVQVARVWRLQGAVQVEGSGEVKWMVFLLSLLHLHLTCSRGATISGVRL